MSEKWLLGDKLGNSAWSGIRKESATLWEEECELDAIFLIKQSET